MKIGPLIAIGCQATPDEKYTVRRCGDSTACRLPRKTRVPYGRTAVVRSPNVPPVPCAYHCSSTAATSESAASKDSTFGTLWSLVSAGL
ncbi:hypothetical protein [Micromonospora sp. RTP1Z1]|uniref:hypothetical protein n=1 Tax=Micromonospora sp. RTP1Z1 TaxID=2994043 RepID=UPI0029C6698C|nr:hypothetical protein [Micromonospora sp. RTP1Z1]